MKILVDEMPKNAEECVFCNACDYVCGISGGDCDMFFNYALCPYLKEYKPAEDDCK